MGRCPASGSDVWVLLKWRLQVVRNVGFLVAMSFLDVRDLWYKLTWVGPYDAYAFDAGSRGTLLDTTLPLSVARPAPFTELKTQLFSGWPSYLSRCDNLTAFCSPGSTFFLNAMGRNCEVGVNETNTIDRLVMTSNVRSDAMAWAACQLLYGHRRPGICHENIASNFQDRYNFQAMPVDPAWVAPVDSQAEGELLRFLELIAMSHPRYKLVCTGGFAYNAGPGRYNPTVFGCSSANVYRAEYVGVYATHFHKLAYDKAWLTAIDIVTLVDVSYNIRQNTINVFDMEEELVDGKLLISVTETTINNFVSTGLLYILMIIVDSLLLLAQMYTAHELVVKWILPLMRKRDNEELRSHVASDVGGESTAKPQQPTVSTFVGQDEDAFFSQEEYTSFLSTSLYRHPWVIVLTIVSQLLSWGIIIPNSVVWTWSLSDYSKVMAFFSSLRIWTLILVGVNGVWDFVVHLSEKHAYAFTRSTFVTSFEIMAVGAVVAFSKKDAVMAISEVKFGSEHQRINDFVSFPMYIAHGNTFNEDLGYGPNSPRALLSVMYTPLIEIVCYSVLGVYLWATVKLLCYRLLETPPFSRWIYTIKTALGRKPMQYLRSAAATVDPALRRKQMLNSAHVLDPRDQVYSRVALEKMVDIPMRARSLVRPTLSMQKNFNGEVMLRPSVHLDFGIFVKHRVISARAGFESCVRAVASIPAPETSCNTRTVTMSAINATNFARGLQEEDGHMDDSDNQLVREIAEQEEKLHAMRKKRSSRAFAAVHIARGES